MGSWLSFDEFLTDDMAADVRDLDTYSPRDYRAALLREAIPVHDRLAQGHGFGEPCDAVGEDERRF